MGAIATTGRRQTHAARLLSLLRATEHERDERARRPAARSRRDWIVDTACFLLAVAGGIYGPGALLENGAEPSPAAAALIVAAGVVACVAIWLRRRWPVGVAILAVVLGSVSPAAGGASLIALFTVAVHRRSVVAIALAALAIALLPVYFSIYPDEIPFWVNVALATGIQAAVVGWGMFIRSQRELMLALRERTRQAEAERDLRVAQARSQERTRIAREMHDVLAHRISLLSLHAGALEVHPDAPPAEIARAAGVVRACAHEALEDLREVIGVLRTDPPDGASERPQPTIADVADLVEESRAAGMAVSLAQRADAREPARRNRPDGLPDRAGGPDERAQARAERRGRRDDRRRAGRRARG